MHVPRATAIPGSAVLSIVLSANTTWYVIPVDEEEKRLVFQRGLKCEYVL
jgi:hypothetical protein